MTPLLALFCALTVTAVDYGVKTNATTLGTDAGTFGVRAVTTSVTTNGATFHGIRLESGENPVRDRALVARFLLPCAEPAGFLHTHFPRVPVKIGSRRQDYPAMLGWGDAELGSSKMVSGVPLVGVSAAGRAEGLAFGVAMTCPVVCRLGFDAASNALYVECDVGLAPEKPFADVRLVSFSFAAEDGFRGAWERYTALHADDFAVRVKRHGTWLCGVTADKVPDWQDFGFTFMEKTWDVPGDDARGIWTFRYTSSSTWTIPIPTNLPNDVASARLVAEERAAKGDPMARAWRTCRFLDRHGEPACRFFNEHWLRGVSWNLNAEPDLPGEMTPFLAKGNSKAELDARYAGTFPNGVDGEFVDSASGFGVCALDFNRAHFAHMKDVPLCFAHEDGRVGIHKVSSTRAYIRRLASEVHARGRFMMVNDCAGLYHFIAPYADILCIEVSSLEPAGTYRERWPKDHKMLQYRMLAGKKPYCFFQNTNFNRLDAGLCERYMQRALAYGILPSFYSPVGCGTSTRFFAHPEWRERVRPLFKKYFPTLKAVSEAGWEPVARTLASTVPDDVNVEQFGTPGSSGGCYATVHNPSGRPVEATLRPVRGFRAAEAYVDAVTAERVPVGKTFTLPAYATRVLNLNTAATSD